jgi:hypothetical protein
MDTAAGFDHLRTDIDEATDGALDDQAFDLDGSERRMHVRAYNHWVSLLGGAPFPAIDRLNLEQLSDFEPHSVVLDFSDGIDDPAISYLGATLREECGLDHEIRRVADVPGRSPLSRLTDHYLQIIANRAPIGFEAEFVSSNGNPTLYRGILMPFSSNGVDIDFIFGVINWKVIADAQLQETLTAELDAAVRAAPSAGLAPPVWADAPSAGRVVETAIDEEAIATEEHVADMPPAGSLGDWLAMARESAAQARAADTRGRAALYRALGRAHDFAIAADADADAYHELLEDSLIKPQARAPMTPIVKLVFGHDYDKTRLAEYAAVLNHARRNEVGTGALPAFLDKFGGGVKAVVKAERAARRPAKQPDLYERAVAELRGMPVLANVPIGAGEGEFVVMLARPAVDGTLDVIARVDAKHIVETVVKRAAA